MQNFTEPPIVSESLKKSFDFNPCPRVTKFSKTFTWISAALSGRPASLYLLCNTDRNDCGIGDN